MIVWGGADQTNVVARAGASRFSERAIVGP